MRSGGRPAFASRLRFGRCWCLLHAADFKHPTMESTPALTGIHHLTAVTANASLNHAFYTQVLGLRMVKKTVNQDDVSAYHLFYADGMATPGTDITFFDWPVAPERRGTRSLVQTGLRVAGQATLEWWLARFAAKGVRHAGIVTRDGRGTLDFEDPEGQRLSLVNDGGIGEAHPWEKSPVPAEHQIRGLGPITDERPGPGRDRPRPDRGAQHAGRAHLRAIRRRTGRPCMSTAWGEAVPRRSCTSPSSRAPPLRAAGRGVSTTWPSARRTTANTPGWTERLESMGMPTSGPVDRYYFRSLYFREPNGILFEIATDGPGFAADEPLESLGEKLALPPFLEPRRSQIEAGLKPL